MYYSCVVIILLNTDLCIFDLFFQKSSFSFFCDLFFVYLFCFEVHVIDEISLMICVINAYMGPKRFMRYCSH